MPVPTRPVALADIETEWGQEVHDRVFAPKGCRVSGAAVTMLASQAYRTIPLDTAGDDPSGFLDANDRIEVPTDCEGLYWVVLRANTVNGASSDQTRIIVRLNGSELMRTLEDQSGGTNVPLSVSTLVELVATDQVDVRAQQIGSGTRASVSVLSLQVLRVGAEYG